MELKKQGIKGAKRMTEKIRPQGSNSELNKFGESGKAW